MCVSHPGVGRMLLLSAMTPKLVLLISTVKCCRKRKTTKMRRDIDTIYAQYAKMPCVLF